MSLAPGRTLSHYRLIEQIGEGAMGVVWRATDTTLGRDVAIKVLPEAVANDPERMTRFEREARLLASLSQFAPQLSPDGRLLTFLNDESGKNQTYVVAFHADGSTGRPVEVKTSGSVIHRWSADGKTLFVEDERHRLMKVAVTAGSELSVSSPTLVHDFDKLRVQTLLWNVLPDGRFFVGLKNENDDEITRYNLVQNWTEVLKQKMEAAR